jgi:hypothetical protein
MSQPVLSGGAIVIVVLVLAMFPGAGVMVGLVPGNSPDARIPLISTSVNESATLRLEMEIVPPA